MKRKYKIIADIAAIIIAFGICSTFLVMMTGCKQTPTGNLIVTPQTTQNGPNTAIIIPEGTPGIANGTEPVNTTNLIQNTTRPNAAPSSAPASLTYNILIENYNFVPNTVSINQGETVIWTNRDSVAHAIISDTGTEIDSGLIAPGATFTQTFGTDGTFAYHCSIHPTMHGTINVGIQQPSQASNDVNSNADQNATQPTGANSGGTGYGGGYYY